MKKGENEAIRSRQNTNYGSTKLALIFYRIEQKSAQLHLIIGWQEVLLQSFYVIFCEKLKKMAKELVSLTGFGIALHRTCDVLHGHLDISLHWRGTVPCISRGLCKPWGDQRRGWLLDRMSTPNSAAGSATRPLHTWSLSHCNQWQVLKPRLPEVDGCSQGRSEGRWHEVWNLKWDPVYSILLRQGY